MTTPATVFISYAWESDAFRTQEGGADIAQCRGFWLPGPDNESPLLITLAQAARYMLAGLGALSPHISLQHLDAVANQLHALEKQLLTSKDPLARFLPPVLQTWRGVLEGARSAAAATAQIMLPNPFVTGLPPSPDMSWGQAVFRGRETLIGPRRCSKSLLLNMLRVMLPDTIVVLFDLQSNPVDTPTAFYQDLAHTAREKAQRSHRLQLPELVCNAQNGQLKSPIEALKHWLDQLDQFAIETQRQHRILICIDEFERLETLFPDQNREMLQLMGLFCATIQHGRRLRLLVAGAAPFDELGKLWNDHFINLREMRLGFLDEETVVQLLTNPIEEFPPGAISAELAYEIYRRSRGRMLVDDDGQLLVPLFGRWIREKDAMV